MKDFDSFLVECAKNGLQSKIAESAETLTNQQILDVLRVSLQILKAYHEWNQKGIDG